MTVMSKVISVISFPDYPRLVMYRCSKTWQCSYGSLITFPSWWSRRFAQMIIYLSLMNDHGHFFEILVCAFFPIRRREARFLDTSPQTLCSKCSSVIHHCRHSQLSTPLAFMDTISQTSSLWLRWRPQSVCWRPS